jgi:hypothetical protein
MNACFSAAAALMSPKFIPVQVPYPGRPLPGWLLVPPGPAIRRPAVILSNTSDGQNIDCYVYGGRAALERGWNALIFEGPGQGARLVYAGPASLLELRASHQSWDARQPPSAARPLSTWTICTGLIHTTLPRAVFTCRSDLDASAALISSTTTSTPDST